MTKELIDEAISSLRELTQIYADDLGGGRLMTYEDQPQCIQRALVVLGRLDGVSPDGARILLERT